MSTADADVGPTRNREHQAAVYGEPLGVIIRRLGEQLGLTQARIGAVLGISPPMLSQLVTGRRTKIGNPVAVQRLQELVALGAAVAAGQVTSNEVEAQLVEIGRQAAVITQGTATRLTRGSISDAQSVQVVQALFRSVADAEEILAAAAELRPAHPQLADLLLVYGCGRTAEAIAHWGAHRP